MRYEKRRGEKLSVETNKVDGLGEETKKTEASCVRVSLRKKREILAWSCP